MGGGGHRTTSFNQRFGNLARNRRTPDERFYPRRLSARAGAVSAALARTRITHVVAVAAKKLRERDHLHALFAAGVAKVRPDGPHLRQVGAQAGQGRPSRCADGHGDVGVLELSGLRSKPLDVGRVDRVPIRAECRGQGRPRQENVWRSRLRGRQPQPRLRWQGEAEGSWRESLLVRMYAEGRRVLLSTIASPAIT